jgi:hypothetical protein
MIDGERNECARERGYGGVVRFQWLHLSFGSPSTSSG